MLERRPQWRFADASTLVSWKEDERPTAAGLGFGDAVKFAIMLADMRRWAEVNAVYVTYFDPQRLPARSAFGASGLALGGEVEVECVAYWPRER